MVWTITAEPYGSTLPGSARITVTGDADATVVIMRRDKNGTYPVRTPVTLSASGLGTVVDAEASFGAVTYSLPTGETASTTIPPLPSGRALLRSLIRPYVTWTDVALVTETDVQYPTSSTVFPIIGASNPVVVADIRRERSGVFVFLAADTAEADSLLFVLRDGVPFLLRLCDNGAGKVRDAYFYALNIGEARVSDHGKQRLITVDYQSVDQVLGVTDVPTGQAWTYGDLKASPAASTYAAVRSSWSNYLELATVPK